MLTNTRTIRYPEICAFPLSGFDSFALLFVAHLICEVGKCCRVDRDLLSLASTSAILIQDRCQLGIFLSWIELQF